MRLKSILFLIFVSLLATGVAQATTVIQLDLVQHLKDSTAVIEAQVGETAQGIDAATGRPFTDTQLRVDRVLFGQAPDSLAIRQHKGTIDGKVHAIIGDGELEPGSNVLLFVMKHTDNRWYLTALAQSVYTIVGSGPDAKVERSLDSLVFMERDAQGRLIPAHPKDEKDLNLGRLRGLISEAARKL